MIDFLAKQSTRLIALFVNELVDLLIDCFVGLLIDNFIDWSVGKLIDRLIDWLIIIVDFVKYPVAGVTPLSKSVNVPVKAEYAAAPQISKPNQADEDDVLATLLKYEKEVKMEKKDKKRKSEDTAGNRSGVESVFGILYKIARIRILSWINYRILLIRIQILYLIV